MNVFVVDDSDAMRALVCHMIARVDGLVVTGEFISATRTIAALRNATPELIVLDFQLAEGCAIDVLHAAARDYPAIKVIVMTYYADSSVRRHVMTAGAYAVFDKSRDLEDLWVLLQRLAGRAPRPDTGSAAAATPGEYDIWRDDLAQFMQAMRTGGAVGQTARARAWRRLRSSKARR